MLLRNCRGSMAMDFQPVTPRLNDLVAVGSAARATGAVTLDFFAAQ
jgi:hypothetical protein